MRSLPAQPPSVTCSWQRPLCASHAHLSPPRMEGSTRHTHRALLSHRPASDHLAAQHLQTPSHSATSTSVQGDTRHHVLPEGGCQPLPCGYPWRSGASRGHFLPCPWICHRALSHPQNAEVPRREGDAGFGEGLGPDLSHLRLLGCEEPAHSSGGPRGCWKWRQWVTTVPGRQGARRQTAAGCRVRLPQELVPPNTAPAGASPEPRASQEGVLQPGL